MSPNEQTVVDAESPFAVQSDIRRPWRQYLDSLTPLRPDLHRYCCRLTGNLWDGEDLVQDALVRVFGLLGKIDADLENPRAYLIRTATHLWIDRMRRRDRERAWLEGAGPEAAPRPAADPSEGTAVRQAATVLFERLAPRERAAVALKDVFDLSLEETAALLQTTTGAVKSALHRGRKRLDEEHDPMHDTTSERSVPSRDLVEAFTKALAAKDLDGLQAICSTDLNVELVGGAELDGFERSRSFFEHAHMVIPQLGFGENPRWETWEVDGEPMVLGFRTLDGVEGLNEVHRIEVVDDRIAQVRCYCFCPDTLRALGEKLGLAVLGRAYRSPG